MKVKLRCDHCERKFKARFTEFERTARCPKCRMLHTDKDVERCRVEPRRPFRWLGLKALLPFVLVGRGAKGVGRGVRATARGAWWCVPKPWRWLRRKKTAKVSLTLNTQDFDKKMAECNAVVDNFRARVEGIDAKQQKKKEPVGFDIHVDRIYDKKSKGWGWVGNVPDRPLQPGDRVRVDCEGCESLGRCSYKDMDGEGIFQRPSSLSADESRLSMGGEDHICPTSQLIRIEEEPKKEGQSAIEGFFDNDNPEVIECMCGEKMLPWDFARDIQVNQDYSTRQHMGTYATEQVPIGSPALKVGGHCPKCRADISCEWMQAGQIISLNITQRGGLC